MKLRSTIKLEMDKVILCISLCLISFYGFAQPFHSLSLERANGGAMSLNVFSDQKVLILITSTGNSAGMKGLSDFYNKFPGIKVIGIPVKRFLTNPDLLSGDITSVSDGVIFGSEVSDSFSVNETVIRWLSKKESNRHFSVKDIEVGQKYFIDESGELYAIMPPQFSFSDPRMDKIINRKMPSLSTPK